MILGEEFQNDREYLQILDSLRIGVVVHNRDTVIAFSNTAASEILGLSKDQMSGRTAIDPTWHFVRDDESPMPVEEYPISVVLSRQEALRNYIAGIVRPDREQITWVAVDAIALVDESGAINQVVVSFVDVTAQRQAQHLSDALLTKQKGMFAVVAHELRTPVAAIAMMAKEEDSQEWQKSKQLVLERSNDLLNTIDDMKMLISPETNRPIRAEAFSIRDLNHSINASVDSIVSATQVQYRQYDALPVSMSEERFFADTYRVRVAVINLIRNSCLHSEGSNVWMVSRLYNDKARGAYLEWLVADNGVGIPSEQVARLFRQGERGASKADGIGVGLYITKTWIEEIGGEVEYRPRSGGGSEFLVRIPLIYTSEADSIDPAIDQGEEKFLSQQIAGLKVLFVEDDPVLRMLGQKLLTGLVAEVQIAENGREGLHLYDPNYDLIMTDYFMPEMSGVEMTCKIRAQGYQGVIIGVTAATIGNQQNEMLEAGVDRVLPKPLTASLFKDAMAEFIKAGRFGQKTAPGEASDD